MVEIFAPYKARLDEPAQRCADIDQTTFDLSLKNPNGGEEVTHRRPEAIMGEIAALDADSAEVLQTIRGLL